MTARERLEAARARVNAKQAEREANIAAEQADIKRRLDAFKNGSGNDVLRGYVQETARGIKNRVSLEDALGRL